MRALLITLISIVVVLAGGAGALLSGRLGVVTAKCSVGGILVGGNTCTFANQGALPGKKCVRVKVYAKEGVAVAYSSPVCSGLVWGSGTVKVEIADFDRELHEMCPSFADCSMDVLNDDEGTVRMIASRPSVEEERRAAPPLVVSEEEYDQLRNGMKYKQVKEIVGSDGKEISSSDIAGYSTVMMEWNNPDHSSMTLMFQNGRVTMKNQFRLPPTKAR